MNNVKIRNAHLLKKATNGRNIRLEWIAAKDCVTLKRNPQYLTPHEMEAMKRSIKRDGFVVPILVRPLSGGRYEVVSGNHRLLAAREIGQEKIPAVVATLNDRDMKRLAINLNTIHGEPNAELLAPFLAEMEDEVLKDIHLEDDLLKELIAFDETLEKRLSSLSVPDSLDIDSTKNTRPDCKCSKCGRLHVKNVPARDLSKSSSDGRKNMRASNRS